MISINLLGTIRLTSALLPLLKRGGSASMSGRITLPFLTPYTISKFGVEGYAGCMRFQLCVYGITIHVVEPRAFNTRLTDHDTINARQRHTFAKLPESLQKEYGEQYLETLSKPGKVSSHLVVCTRWQLPTNTPCLARGRGLVTQLDLTPRYW